MSNLADFSVGCCLNGLKVAGMVLAFGVGLAVGFFILYLWGVFTSSVVGVFGLSLLAPNGAQIYVLGYRIKHAYIGLGLVAFGSLLIAFKKITGSFLVGLGLALVVDEIGEL